MHSLNTVSAAWILLKGRAGWWVKWLIHVQFHLFIVPVTRQNLTQVKTEGAGNTVEKSSKLMFQVNQYILFLYEISNICRLFSKFNTSSTSIKNWLEESSGQGNNCGGQWTGNISVQDCSANIKIMLNGQNNSILRLVSKGRVGFRDSLTGWQNSDDV